MFSFVFSEYDFLPFSQAQVFPPSHSGRGGALVALFHAGERSAPQRENAARNGRENAGPAGVRALVQPWDALGSVRSPARAAHARCSKLERLPERRPRPSARISKDE